MILFCPGGGLPVSGQLHGGFPGKPLLGSIPPCNEPVTQSVRGAAWLCTSAHSQSLCEDLELSPRDLSSSASPQCNWGLLDPEIDAGA
jgi:hypothetical protein